MEIIKTLRPGACDITLSGKFTFNDHMAFRAVLELLGENGVEQVVLHMAQVEFIDSAALGMLLLALDEAEKRHKRLVISGATGQVKKMFDLAQFGNLFTLS